MVSMQPVTQSYVEEPESCFMTTTKCYTKGSIMDILISESPLMAYLCQVSFLDDTLDSSDFNGTVFAPCESYCIQYFEVFKDKIDHLTARNIVLSNLLYANLTKENLLTYYDILPTLNADKTISIKNNKIDNLVFTKANIKCNNGVIHLLNGLLN